MIRRMGYAPESRNLQRHLADCLNTTCGGLCWGFWWRRSRYYCLLWHSPGPRVNRRKWDLTPLLDLPFNRLADAIPCWSQGFIRVLSMSNARVLIVCVQIIAALAALPVSVHAQTSGGLSARPGMSTVRSATGLRPLRGGSSVIGDGMGGFTIYNSTGATRHIGGASVPGSVYDAEGGRYQVIEDGQGNLNVHGPAGTRKVMRTRRHGAADTSPAESAE